MTASLDKTAKIWDTTTGALLHSLEGHTSDVNLSTYSPNGKTILTASDDGSIILWNAQTGRKFIQGFIFDGDPNKWVHIADNGFFDASPEAMGMMYWTKGLEVIEFSQLKDRYWIPSLWEKVMKGEELPKTRGIGELKLQPEVEVEEVKNGKIPVQLTKRDGGYGKVSIFINGKEVATDVRGPGFDTTLIVQTLYYSIEDHPYLKDGENTIEVKSSSADGFVQGSGTTVTYTHKKEDVKPVQFFSVVVGVGDYLNDAINLKYTVPDAKAIANAFQIGSENLFSKERTFIYTLTTDDELQPNKENIRKIFTEISKKAKAEDIITIYLSGHGITWGGNQGDFYYLTSDATAADVDAYNDPVIRQNNAISSSEMVEWLKEIPALKQVMIIDACGSGKAVENLIASRTIDPSQIKAIDRMKDRTGMYIISGCAADAVSYEASQYGQGLLTYSILQGMKGAALKEDQYVDINTILNFAKDNVPRLAEGIGGIQKPQLLIPKSGSFDIGILPIESRNLISLASPKRVFVRSTVVDADEFEDVLKLSLALDKELSLVSAKGIESPLVFFDAREYPNGCKITGGYRQEEGKIKLDMKVKCGEEQTRHSLEAENKEELVKVILNAIK